MSSSRRQVDSLLFASSHCMSRRHQFEAYGYVVLGC